VIPTGPPITWITLEEESTLTAEGLPEEAPVLVFEKGVSVFASTSYIIHDLLGSTEAEITHDPDWNVFPEIANALRAAGLEEHCLAVAKAEGRWGVGMAGNWKQRENASKLALCVALSVDHPNQAVILRNHKEFCDMLVKAELCEAPPPGPAPAARGKKSKATDDDDDGSALPVVHQIVLTEESPLTEQGFPADGPALVHDKSMYCFSESHNILCELVGDIQEEVVFNHDADGDKFPEVGRAVKETTGTDWCACVATCSNLGKWGIGLAGGWKARETSAKLALAVSICSEGGPNLDAMASSYPTFGQLCASAGYEPSGGLLPPEPAAEKPAKKKAKKGGAAEDEELAAMGGLGGSTADVKAALPKNKPFWLNMPAAPAVLVDDMPSETLMLFGEENARKALYTHVDKFLAEFVESVETDIEYVDDPNWEQFPEIAAALEEYNVQDYCLHVAVCGNAGVWAASAGRKWKTRNAAAKVALGAVLALRLADSGTGPDMTAFPEFSKFIEEAAAAA
jgi:hypothetical protein